MTLSHVCRSRLIEKSKRLSRQHRQLQYNRIRVAPFQAEASKQPEHDHLKKSIKKRRILREDDFTSQNISVAIF